MKCKRCPGETSTGVYCPPCRIYVNDLKAKQRTEKKARGECYKCSAMAREDSVLCAKHADSMAAQAKIRRNAADDEKPDADEPKAMVARCRRCWLALPHDCLPTSAVAYVQQSRERWGYIAPARRGAA